MIKRKIIAAILAVVTVISLAACSVDLSSTEEESRIVMTVDGWDVPYEMYRYAVMMHMRDQADVFLAKAKENAEAVSSSADTDTEGAKAAAGAESRDFNEIISDALAGMSEDEKKAFAEEIQGYAIDTIVNIYSLFTAAREMGIEAFGETLNSRTDMKMEEIRATYKNDREYLNTLKMFYMNNSVYSVLTRYELVFDQLYEVYVREGKIDISDEAIIDHMNSKNAVRVKQILISFERHTEAEALVIANEVYGKLAAYVDENGIADEDEFDLLTDEYGEDLFMFKNRDGYYIPRGYADENFEKAAFALDVGKLSGIVRTSAGYSIMLRAEKDPDFIEDNLDTLKDTCIGGIYRSMLDEFSAAAKTVKVEGFENISILEMK